MLGFEVQTNRKSTSSFLRGGLLSPILRHTHITTHVNEVDRSGEPTPWAGARTTGQLPPEAHGSL